VDESCSIMHINVTLHGNLLHMKEKFYSKNWVMDFKKMKSQKQKLCWIHKSFPFLLMLCLLHQVYFDIYVAFRSSLHNMMATLTSDMIKVESKMK
jgi:hypothetical protein